MVVEVVVRSSRDGEGVVRPISTQISKCQACYMGRVRREEGEERGFVCHRGYAGYEW